MLAQDYWCHKYSYISYSHPDREDYIVSRFIDPTLRKLSVDVVRLAIDLAHMPTQQVKDYDFDPLSLN